MSLFSTQFNDVNWDTTNFHYKIFEHLVNPDSTALYLSPSWFECSKSFTAGATIFDKVLNIAETDT